MPTRDFCGTRKIVSSHIICRCRRERKEKSEERSVLKPTSDDGTVNREGVSDTLVQEGKIAYHLTLANEIA